MEETRLDAAIISDLSWDDVDTEGGIIKVVCTQVVIRPDDGVIKTDGI